MTDGESTGDDAAVTESLAEAFDDGAGGRLATLRNSPRERRRLTVAGAVVGFAAAVGHWLGFVLGGALVSLPQVSIRRGLAAGLGFGVVAWIAFLAFLGISGALDTYVQMGPIVAISAATPILGGLLGSLLRGVV